MILQKLAYNHFNGHFLGWPTLAGSPQKYPKKHQVCTIFDKQDAVCNVKPTVLKH